MVGVEVMVGVKVGVEVKVEVGVKVNVWVDVNVSVGVEVLVQADAVAVCALAVKVDCCSGEGPHPASTKQAEKKRIYREAGLGRMVYQSGMNWKEGKALP